MFIGATPIAGGPRRDLRRFSIPTSSSYRENSAKFDRMSSVFEEENDHQQQTLISAASSYRTLYYLPRGVERQGMTSVKKYRQDMPESKKLLLHKRSSVASRNEEVMRQPAETWACRPYGILVGTGHLLAGSFLLLFDVATNRITETAFAITASICFIISGILALISSRRLDRSSLLLLLFFSILSMAMCGAMFIESSLIINRYCHQPNTIIISSGSSGQESQSPKISEAYRMCRTNIHSVLICVSLIEALICLISLIVCFRSLSRAYGQIEPRSPFTTLMIGDYQQLPRLPVRFLTDKKENKLNFLYTIRR